jgi:L-ascorbate metabolism protein UlaG (beta-lactamase superfamily)
VSWLIEAGGHRVLHLGDTIYHGYWWRMAQRHGPFDAVFAPINGAVVRFPHRRPASPIEATLTPEQAALAGELLGARVIVPMHYDGYRLEPFYVPVDGAAEAFTSAAAGRPYEARTLKVGETLELGGSAWSLRTGSSAPAGANDFGLAPRDQTH